jgi:hypothetical protein
MTTSNELFFIPIIAEALRRPDRQPALREAFERIMEVGRNESFRFGYRQFLQFMACSMDQWTESATQLVDDLQSFPASETPNRCAVVLERAGHILGNWTFTAPPFRTSIANAKPGFYRLSMDTGRVLWEGSLTPSDLFFTHAFPDQALPLAAQTDQASPRPTRELFLLDGALAIGVYAGLEGGMLELQFR